MSIAGEFTENGNGFIIFVEAVADELNKSEDSLMIRFIEIFQFSVFVVDSEGMLSK